MFIRGVSLRVRNGQFANMMRYKVIEDEIEQKKYQNILDLIRLWFIHWEIDGDKLRCFADMRNCSNKEIEIMNNLWYN